MADLLLKRRTGRLSFSLRTLLVGIAALAICLGWWVSAARQQHRAVEAIRNIYTEAGQGEPNLFYNFQVFDEGDVSGMLHNPFQYSGVGIDYDAQPRASTWEVSALGEDYFHRIVAVWVHGHPSVISNVSRFSHLRHLVLWSDFDNKCRLTDESVAWLVGMQNLKSLEVDARELTNDALRSISGLSKLEYLDLCCDAFTDDGLRNLIALSRLRELYVGDMLNRGERHITDAGVAHLAGLADLEQLVISSDKLTGAALTHLGKIKKLKFLGLNSPQLIDDDLERLADFPALQHLWLFHTSIDGTGFRHLAGNNMVTSVHLGGTKVNDKGVAHLAGLPNLEWVNVVGTRVTAQGLECLKACKKLRVVWISPELPGDIQNLERVLPSDTLTVDDDRQF